MKTVDDRWEARLARVLGDLTGSTAPVLNSGSGRGDLMVDIAGHRYVFHLKSAGQGYPQDVRRARRDAFSEGRIVVLFAAEFSPGARRMMREERQSYIDEAGAAFLAASPGLFVHTDPQRPPRRQGRQRWSSGFADTAELLLTLPDEALPSITDLSERLPLSRATIGKAMLFFDAEGWTTHVGPARGAAAQRVMSDRAGMLGSWSRWTVDNPRGPVLLAHASWQDPWTFLQDRLAPVLTPGAWCLSGWAAAELMAPYSTSLPSLHLYVEQEHWARASMAVEEVARPVEQGERIRLTALPGRLIDLGQRLTWPVADAPRVYADLLGEGSRGENAADHLREVCLGF